MRVLIYKMSTIQRCSYPDKAQTKSILLREICPSIIISEFEVAVSVITDISNISAVDVGWLSLVIVRMGSNIHKGASVQKIKQPV